MRKITMLVLTVAFLGSQVMASNSFKTKIYKEKHRLGLKRDKEKHKRFLMTAAPGIFADLPVPAKKDLSPKVSPPENQGNCGSCWAFGITKALRSALMLAGKDPGTLAFNYLVNNCGAGPKMWGCQGGDFDAGQSFLNGGGPWLEAQDPYTQRDHGRCLGLPAAGTALSYKLVGSASRPTFKELAQALSADHLLVVDVAVCGSWGSYAGGIFNLNQCGPNSINHIVNMNGYDCQTSVDATGNCLFNAAGEPANGDGFLIVMNNWGTNWGEQGYMRTKAHVDAIANTAMYFEVEQPAPPPLPPKPSGALPVWVWFALGGLGLVIVVLVIEGIHHLFFEKK